MQRVVHALVEALVALGQDVTLMAPRGSHCSGRTIELDEYGSFHHFHQISRRLSFLSEEPLYEAIRNYVREEQVDVIHDWSFFHHYSCRHPDGVPSIASVCTPLPPQFQRFNVVACSLAHSRQCRVPGHFVHYGIDMQGWEFSAEKTRHLIHIARIARHKGQHIAIRLARATGREVLIAGNVEDVLYHNFVVRPLCALTPNARLVGELRGTNEHLVQAAALLQTPREFDPAPFVIIESLASGTPVISLDSGGIKELIVQGETGFVAPGLSGLVEAVARLDEVRPEICRDYAQQHFTSRRMAEQYLDYYHRVADGERWETTSARD